jgi:hypothetical protein
VTDDPGPEFWARQHDQLVVINELQRLIDEQSDRFTGLVTNGSGHVVIHVVDTAVVEEERFRALLQVARREGIEVEVVPGLRPLRTLKRIMDDVIRGEVFAGARPVSCGIDVATSTVQVTVAARAVEEARRACARYDGAVVVIAVDRNAFGPLPGRRDSPAGWPVPSVAPMSTIGQPVAGVADRYRAEGFTVQIIDPDIHGGVDLSLNTHRIRLLVHDGVIVDGSQG